MSQERLDPRLGTCFDARPDPIFLVSTPGQLGDSGSDGGVSCGYIHLRQVYEKDG